MHPMVGEHDHRRAVEHAGSIDLGEGVTHPGIGIANRGRIMSDRGPPL